MPSEVNIANAALRLLGEKTIAALTDDTERAKVVNDLFALVRDETLRAHPWKFALKRVELAKDVTGPIFEFANAYTLPAESLRVVNTDWTPPPLWKIEGRKLLTDQGPPIKLVYIERVTDPNLFDSLFTMTFAVHLAAQMAGAIAGNFTRGRDLYLIYKDKLSEARSISGQEGVPEAFDTSWLTAARS